MIGFIFGTLFGGIVGILAMCLCRVASDADKCMDYTDSDK